MMGLLEHFAKVPASAAKAQHPLHRLGGSSRRSRHALAARGPRHGAREDGADDQPRARLRRPNEVLGPEAPQDDRRGADALVGVGQQAVARYRAELLQRFNVGLTADMDDGASGEMGQVARRRAVDAGDHVARGQAHRTGHRRVGAGRRDCEQIARAYAKIIDDIGKYSLQQLQPARAAVTSAR